MHDQVSEFVGDSQPVAIGGQVFVDVYNRDITIDPGTETGEFAEIQGDDDDAMVFDPFGETRDAALGDLPEFAKAAGENI
jgi:hypothetical protein